MCSRAHINSLWLECVFDFAYNSMHILIVPFFARSQTDSFHLILIFFKIIYDIFFRHLSWISILFDDLSHFSCSLFYWYCYIIAVVAVVEFLCEFSIHSPCRTCMLLKATGRVPCSSVRVFLEWEKNRWNWISSWWNHLNMFRFGEYTDVVLYTDEKRASVSQSEAR